MSIHTNSNEKRRISTILAQFETKLIDLDSRIREFKEDYTVEALNLNTSLQENRILFKQTRAFARLLSDKADTECTIRYLRSLLDRKIAFRPESYFITPESGEPDKDELKSSLTLDTQNVTDVAGMEVDDRSFGDSIGLATGQMGVLSMEEFLERPVEIADGTIASGASLSAQYAIWDIITKHPSVRAKFRNYAFFRGTLNLRIAVSGSPFHTGRILASYQPHAGKNANLLAHDANILVDSAYRPVLLNYLSQAPGAVTIDVRENRPVEMVIPFVSPKPMLRLYNNSSAAVSAATSFLDFVDMGDLFFYTIDAIGNVSASTASPVSYVIYAWFTDVQLGVPTATHLEITTESADEQVRGPVEKITSGAAKIAGALNVIPILRPFTLPSQLILKGLSAIASWFGWSRPPIIDQPVISKNMPFMSHCQTIGSETVSRITLDPKQELAIDSLMCGSQHDDLVIAALAKRETLFDSFTWADDDPIKVPIAKYIVHPQMNTYYSDVGATAMTLVQPSAMSYTATPFSYWRGDITFRLDFVTSQYHRGKIAIWYEPNHFHETLISADMSLNKNFIQIVDLAVTSTVEFTVEWASHYPWLRTFGPEDIKTAHNFGAILVDLNEYVNGYISIAPFTTLQSPDSSDVIVHVYCKSDNIRYQQMTNDLPLARDYITPESYFESVTGEEHESQTLNPSTANMDGISMYHFGEQPVSFRSLLKRYATFTTVPVTAAGTYRSVYLGQLVWPNPSPAYNGAAPTYTTLYDYLRYAYLGMRGGRRFRVFIDTEGTMAKTARVFVNINGPEPIAVVNSGTNAAVPRTDVRGAAVFLPETNAGVEVEIPFYSQNAFIFSSATDGEGTTSAGEMSFDYTRKFYIHADISGVANDVTTFVLDHASAEDFTLMRFGGSPYYTYA